MKNSSKEITALGEAIARAALIVSFVSTLVFILLALTSQDLLDKTNLILAQLSISPALLIIMAIILGGILSYSLFQNLKNFYLVMKLSDRKVKELVLVEFIAIFITSSFIAFLLSDILILKIMTDYRQLFASVTFLTALVVFTLSSVYFFIDIKKGEERRIKANNQKSSFLIEDNPCNILLNDKLGYLPFFKRLYKQISTIKFEESFVYLIDGEWGDGKTSIVQTLKDELEKVDDILVYNFNPWNYENEASIQKAFFNELLYALDNKFHLPRLESNIIQDYIDSLEGSVGLNGINFNAKFTKQKENSDVIKQEVNQYIESLKIRIIIIVDDIDRLGKEDILKIFSILKGSARLNRVLYILPFSKKTVMSTLTDSQQGEFKITDTNKTQTFEGNFLIPSNFDVEKYLNKIIQREVRIPDFLSIKLLDVYDSYSEQIKSFLKREKVKNPKLLVEQLRNIIEIDSSNTSNFSNVRNLKRWLNSVIISIIPIMEDVNFTDFSYLELLRLNYNGIYLDIRRSPWIYLGKWDNRDIMEHINEKENETSIRIKSHIDKVISRYPFVDDKRRILFILKHLFWNVNNAYEKYTSGNPQMDDYQRERRLAHPNIFGLYFLDSILPDTISSGYLDDFILEINNLDTKSPDLFENIQAIFNNSLSSLNDKEKLSFIDKLDVQKDEIKNNITIEMFAKCLFMNISQFALKSDVKFRSPYDDVFTIGFYLAKKISSKKIQPFFENIIEKSNDAKLITYIAYYLSDNLADNEKIIIEAIKWRTISTKAANKLHKILQKGEDIFKKYKETNDWIFILYQLNSRWKHPMRSGNDKIVVKFIKEHFKYTQFLEEFIYHIVGKFEYARKGDYSGGMNFGDSFVKPFIDEIYEYVVKKLKSKSTTSEQRKLFKAFRDNYIDYKKK